METFNIDFLVEGESTCTKEALMNVVKDVSRLENEERQDMEDEERPRMWPKQRYHFTLIRYAKARACSCLRQARRRKRSKRVWATSVWIVRVVSVARRAPRVTVASCWSMIAPMHPRRSRLIRREHLSAYGPDQCSKNAETQGVSLPSSIAHDRLVHHSSYLTLMRIDTSMQQACLVLTMSLDV